MKLKIYTVVLPTALMVAAFSAQASILNCGSGSGTIYKHEYGFFSRSVEIFASGEFTPWCDKDGEDLKIGRKQASCLRQMPDTESLDCTPFLSSSPSKTDKLALEFLPSDNFDLPQICDQLLREGFDLSMPVLGTQSMLSYVNTEAQIYGYTKNQHFKDTAGQTTTIVVDRFEIACTIR